MESSSDEADRIARIKAAFRNSDPDGDGQTTPEEIGKLLRLINPQLAESITVPLIEGIKKAGDGKVCYDEFVDFVFGSPAAGNAYHTQEEDDFEPCSFSTLSNLRGIYVGIESEEEGTIKCEMAIDIAEYFSIPGPSFEGVIHWKCLDEGFWHGKRGREFVRGQISATGTFRMSGYRCSPPSGFISCSMYVLQLSSDGSYIHGIFKGETSCDGPFILRQLTAAAANTWRSGRAVTPDCDEDGHLPTPPSCPAGHTLKYFTAFIDDQPCDICRSMLPKGAPMFGCDLCNFDMCIPCREKSSHIDKSL